MYYIVICWVLFGKDDLVHDLVNANTSQQHVRMIMKKCRRPVFVFIQAVLPASMNT